MIKLATKIDSAVVQLTAWYLILIMMVSIGFSVILFNLYSHEFARGLGRQGAIFRDLPQGPNGLIDLDRIRQAQLDESAANLRRNLTIFNLGALVLGGAAAYLLAHRTLKPIQESIESQDRFIADASHELRTPLAAIRAEIEVGMRDSSLSLEEAKKLLTSNLEEVVRLESLSSSLLRLANSTGVVSKSKTELLESLEAGIKSVQTMATQKEIVIENKVVKPVEVQFEKNNLVEIVTILLDNAIKYSPAKTTVTLTSHLKDSHIYLHVKDQGVGIRASDIPHIFDRFYRADHSRTKESDSGYGLGLAIAQKLANSNDAKITVRSTLGQGTVFTVSMVS